MQRGGGGDDPAAGEVERATGEVGDQAAGFADQHGAGGDVPGAQAFLPEQIEAAGGYVGEVQGGAPQAARGWATGSSRSLR